MSVPLASQQATSGDTAPERSTGTWPRRSKRPLDYRLIRIALGLILPGLLLVFWQWKATQDNEALGFLATPRETFETLWALAQDGTLLDSVRASLMRILGGVGIAIIIGVPLGILVSTSRLIEVLLWPFVELLRQVPIPAWVPFTVLFFGIGNKPAVMLIALSAFFPIFMTTVSGVRQIPEIHTRAGSMLGASHRQLLTHVVVPSALPSILTGIRVGTGIGVMVVVLAELIAVRSGIGYMILTGQIQFQGDYVIGGMITISIVGWLLSKLIGGAELYVLRHRGAM